jgi:hypothetical protein
MDAIKVIAVVVVCLLILTAISFIQCKSANQQLDECAKQGKKCKIIYVRGAMGIHHPKVVPDQEEQQ